MKQFTPEVREKIAAIKAKVQQQLVLLEKLEWYAWLEDHGRSWEDVNFVCDEPVRLGRSVPGHRHIRIVFKDGVTHEAWVEFSDAVLFNRDLDIAPGAVAKTIKQEGKI